MSTTNFKQVIADSPYVFIIGVAGGSGSGKTTYTQAIREILGEDLVSTITLDDYHLMDREERKKRNITALSPLANDIPLLECHLEELKKGHTIQKPVYNHVRGTFEHAATFAPTKFVILEGLHTLFTPKLRENLDFSIFVDPAPDVRKDWKIRRDVGDRGYTIEDVVRSMEKRRPDYEKYIGPERRYADVVIGIHYSKYGEDLADKGIYCVTLYQRKQKRYIKNIALSLNLSAMLTPSGRDFLFEYRKDTLDGIRSGALSIDGELEYAVIRKLERDVEKETGVHPISLFEGKAYVNASDVIKLILSWEIIHTRICIEYDNPGSSID
jgi:phosphoribulokinase